MCTGNLICPRVGDSLGLPAPCCATVLSKRGCGVQVVLVAFSVFSGALGALAALIAGLPGLIVTLCYVTFGCLGLLTAAYVLTVEVSGEETTGDPT